jgi:hypothetical protein
MAALAEHDGETIEAINVAIKAIQTLES